MTAQVENASEATQPDAKHSHGSPTFAQNWTADDEDEIRRPEPIAIIGMGRAVSSISGELKLIL